MKEKEKDKSSGRLNSIDILSALKDRATDLKEQGFLPNYKGTRVISPYNSQVCSECYIQGRGLRKTRANTISHDDFKCIDPDCGYVGNRHSNSARISALLLKEQIETVLFPLSTG